MDIRSEIDRFRNEWNNSSSCIRIHTSGSTGEPKDILLPKKLMRNSALRTIDFFGITPESHLHLILSPEYIAGKMMILRSMISSCILTYENPSNDPRLNEDSVDLIAAVPSQVRKIIENKRFDRQRTRLLIGGSAIPLSTRRMIAGSGIEAYESYGMTETASHVALRKITSDPDVPFTLLKGIKASADNDGALHLKSEDFDLHTTDIVEMTGTNSFRYLGRKDMAIVCGGLKIHPELLENKLSALFSEMLPEGSFAVTPVPDDKWGEIPVLAIEKASFADGISERLQQSASWKELGYSRPKKIIVIGEIPLTGNGKINRRLLRESVAHPRK